MASELARLTADIQQKAASLLPGNEDLRQNLLQSAKKLVSALETPEERVYDMCVCEPLLYSATHTLVNLKVFETLSGSNSPKSVAELARSGGADATLLSRLLKHLASKNFIKETGPDEYSANDLTCALASPAGAGTVRSLNLAFRAVPNLPNYFKEVKYANPTDGAHTAWNYGTEIKTPAFEYLLASADEQVAQDFQHQMAFKPGKGAWFNDRTVVDAVFPSHSLPDDDVLMVDVGGSVGQELLAFQQVHSSMPGRRILQDLPNHIDSLDKAALAKQGVEAMVHDFFTPQPVQHAAVYFLKIILHDWPTDKCKSILENLKGSLKPGYSRILLNEVVIPKTGATSIETGTDLLMMMSFASGERRESEWRELVGQVDGLKIRKIWPVSGALEKIIEIELA